MPSRDVRAMPRTLALRKSELCGFKNAIRFVVQWNLKLARLQVTHISDEAAQTAAFSSQSEATDDDLENRARYLYSPKELQAICPPKKYKTDIKRDVCVQCKMMTGISLQRPVNISNQLFGEPSTDCSPARLVFITVVPRPAHSRASKAAEICA